MIEKLPWEVFYDTYCEEVPTVDRSQQGAMAFAVEAMQAEIDRAMDMLGDVPGAHLEDRVERLVGYQLESQLMLAETRDQLATAKSNARKALTEIAALAHRWKWQFDLSEDQKPGGAQARNLITQGFDSLHRLGDQALKSRDSLTDDNRKIAPCDPNDLRPIWEPGLTVSSAYRKDER
jgi:hypothetical protein